jgi:fucose 4-O-acetylase-like acetyltransferase
MTQLLNARPGAASAGDRIPRWDNVRALSATLIVVLHLTGPAVPDGGLIDTFNVTTWPLRVPAFVVLAGVFSHGGPLESRHVRGLIGRLVLPATLCWILLSTEKVLLGMEFTFHLTHWPWTLWFLMALLWWRLMLPLINELRYPLLCTTGLALAAGYFNQIGMNYAGARTFQYLPLFYLGWRLGQGTLCASWFTSRRSLPVAWAGLACALTGVLVFGPPWRYSAMLYARVPMPGEIAWLPRLLVLVFIASVVLCVLRVAPNRRIPYVTSMGAAGFTIYLLHPFFVRPFEVLGYSDRVDTRPEQLALLLSAVALAAFLGSPLVRLLARPLTRPPVGFLFKPTPKDREGKRRDAKDRDAEDRNAKHPDAGDPETADPETADPEDPDAGPERRRRAVTSTG